MIRDDITIPDNKKVTVLLSTCAPGDAERLARMLVEGNHAACVNILPQVTSVYRWQGKVEQETESLLVVKCPREKAEAAAAQLVKEHPYELPEVVALNVDGGNRAYLDWVRGALKG